MTLAIGKKTYNSAKITVDNGEMERQYRTSRETFGSSNQTIAIKAATLPVYESSGSSV